MSMQRMVTSCLVARPVLAYRKGELGGGEADAKSAREFCIGADALQE